ncbi:TRAP transporter small permease subunit [Aliikangiella sp. IMCC44632]
MITTSNPSWGLKLSAMFNGLATICGQAISWLTFAMVVLLSLNVLMSWLLSQSSIMLSEAITWMHAANFLLAAAYTLNRDEHVRVDVLYSKMSLKAKAWVDIIGSLLLLIPTMIFILWSSWSYVLLSWRINEVSAEAGGLPYLFVLKALLLVMPILLIIEAINQLIIKSLQLTADSRQQAAPEAN